MILHSPLATETSFPPSNLWWDALLSLFIICYTNSGWANSPMPCPVLMCPFVNVPPGLHGWLCLSAAVQEGGKLSFSTDGSLQLCTPAKCAISHLMHESLPSRGLIGDTNVRAHIYWEGFVCQINTTAKTTCSRHVGKHSVYFFHWTLLTSLGNSDYYNLILLLGNWEIRKVK